ncbi:MAG TPA: type III pantothenate kinase [Bacteroidales bacterium]|nr:type III pantothenate kinase [Bacteroidales bacterium]
MNLIADVGNTSTKLAFYKGSKKISADRINDLSCEEFENKLADKRIKKVIVSSVKKLPHFVTDLLVSNIPVVHILSHKSKLPFKNNYETPQTLGTDRLAGIAGAYNMFPGENILVIDAGTAITYDYLIGNKYIGGSIAPGLEMRFKALHKYTGKLPLLSLTDEYITPGNNTYNAILSGVINGSIYEINEYIRTFEKKHKKSRVILAGGDSGYLKKKLDDSVIWSPDLVLDGLNYILEYNA